MGGIAAAFLASAAAVFTGISTFRSSARATDIQREQAFDARLDAEMARLRERFDAVAAERDRYREQYARLRIDVIEAGLDPDKLEAPGE